MRTTLRACVGASVTALALVACQPTGVARCDSNVAALVVAENEGYAFDCAPPFPPPSGVIGWADHDTRTLYVWEPRISADKALHKVMWHELGHAVWERHGRSGSQAAEELWADGYLVPHRTGRSARRLVRLPADVLRPLPGVVLVEHFGKNAPPSGTLSHPLG